MIRLDIVSAGAAQAVVEPIAESFRRDRGWDVRTSFSAVGAQKAKVLGGEPVDVIVLTGALIDELTAGGHAAAGSRADLGRVGGGFAVRHGAAQPDMRTRTTLAANIAAARAIYLPDPASATAGAHFMRVCGALGIAADVEPRLKRFPNGNAAMHALAASEGELLLGMTQITEIKLVRGVELVGPLPDEFQLSTTYSAGVAARSAQAEAAREFVARLTGEGSAAMRRAAGFDLG